jgi:hypothetical protein
MLVLNFGHSVKNTNAKQKTKMTQQRKLTRFVSGLGALVLVAGLTAQALLPHTALAAPAQQITDRKLTLEPGATDGGSKPSGTVNHLFNFTLHDLSDNLGSVVFQYCTTAAAVSGGTGCVAPAGINTSGVTLGTENGATGFSAAAAQGYDDAADNVYNAVVLSRTPAALGGSTPVPVSYELDGIVNPSAVNQTFFVRIWTFSTTTPGTLDSASSNDAGTVAAATVNPIILNGTMPESLVFCTGATIGKAGGVPDCTSATSGNISFNQLFDPTSTAHATSQMAASTNAGSGYAITVNGATLTSGSNTISAMGGTAAASTVGVSQFGLNLVKNADFCGTGCDVGSDLDAASNGTNLNGEALTNFNTAASFAFTAGSANTVADSNSKATDSQIYTVAYIVNVPGSQPAGTYVTTLTYICTPTF